MNISPISGLFSFVNSIKKHYLSNSNYNSRQMEILGKALGSQLTVRNTFNNIYDAVGYRCICPAPLCSTFIDHHADNFLVCGRTDLWHSGELHRASRHAGDVVLGRFLHEHGLGRLRGLRRT